MLSPMMDVITPLPEKDKEHNKGLPYFLADVGSSRTTEHSDFRSLLIFVFLVMSMFSMLFFEHEIS